MGRQIYTSSVVNNWRQVQVKSILSMMCSCDVRERESEMEVNRSKIRNMYVARNVDVVVRRHK